jgi:hypothetical protein
LKFIDHADKAIGSCIVADPKNGKNTNDDQFHPASNLL